MRQLGSIQAMVGNSPAVNVSVFLQENRLFSESKCDTAHSSWGLFSTLKAREPHDGALIFLSEVSCK